MGSQATGLGVKNPTEGKRVSGETYGRPPSWTHYYPSVFRLLDHDRRIWPRLRYDLRPLSICPIRRLRPATDLSPPSSRSLTHSLSHPKPEDSQDPVPILSTRARSRELFNDPPRPPRRG